MSEIAASERRLSAALDRIDQILETGRSRSVSPDAAGEPNLRDALEAAQTENARLKAEIAELRKADGALAEPVPGNGEDRLVEAGEQAARLAAANDDLAAANRALVETVAAQADGDSVTAIREALEAEIEALRAARAAEISNLGDIIIELERLLPEADHAAAPAPEMAGDDAGVPEDGGEAGNRDGQGLFSGVYDDVAEDETGVEEK
ncbi:hypothetical protein [Paracoccus methylarcula]|uniref:hypothetical protein n=1 Tax=Paracoccus methylarcula TaxID=72022 RepID=UPI001B85BBBD|nr:hypothetical protein [Paracoccus methylarcula]